MQQTSQEIHELAAALVKAQGQIPVLGKDSEADTGKFTFFYASLAQCINATRKILADNNLAVTQMINDDDGCNTCITTMLMHSSGQYISARCHVPIARLEGKIGENPAQVTGSSISYMRRYAYMSILGMAQEEENDQPGATRSKKNKAPKKPWFNEFEKYHSMMLAEVSNGKKTPQQILNNLLDSYQVNSDTRKAILNLSNEAQQQAQQQQQPQGAQ